MPIGPNGKTGKMTVTVNGKRYEAVRLSARDLKPGALVRYRENRKAYRIVCFDGEDAVLRNMRKPSLLEAEPRDALLRECMLLLPQS